MAEGRIQIAVDMKNRLRILLVDAINFLPLRVGTSPFTRSADVKVASSGSQANSRGICLLETSNPSRSVVDRASSRNDTLSDGRTKRCLYLLDNSSVDDPYSWTYDLKSRFRVMDVTMSAMQAASTNSGLIFTPSVSSSKKRSSPALDAGNGLFFFLLLLIFGTIYFARLGALRLSKIRCVRSR
jgi:hypothetical protein